MYVQKCFIRIAMGRKNKRNEAYQNVNRKDTRVYERMIGMNYRFYE